MRKTIIALALGALLAMPCVLRAEENVHSLETLRYSLMQIGIDGTIIDNAYQQYDEWNH